MGQSGRKWRDAYSATLVFKRRLAQMFLSEYRHNFDTKGRITIPADYRDLLSEGIVIIRGFDKNLMVLTPSDFSVFVSEIQELDITDPQTRRLRRNIFSHAQKAQLDSNGRIIITQHLRDYANLSGDATIIGQFDYFELWSPEDWEEQQTRESETEEQFGDMVRITFANKTKNN